MYFLSLLRSEQSKLQTVEAHTNLICIYRLRLTANVTLINLNAHW